MTTHLRHRTREGERWDQLARIYYGDATAYPQIMAANPDVPRYLQFPAGVVVVIPVVASSDRVTALESPPWLV